MKTYENTFTNGISAMLTRRRNIDLLFWGCIIFLMFLLILNLQEIMQVQAWRHDALYYLSSYRGKLNAEGRWINYYLFDFLKIFPAHASALLSISFFGAFVWIAANKILSWKKSLLITLLCLQINPIWSVIHWPAVILPAHFFFFFCAYLSRKYRYEYILALSCILFHGTFNNLYNLIPLLFISEIKTSRQLFRLFAFWVAFYVCGFIVAELLTKVIAGQFIHMESWRQPHYITSLSVLLQNLVMISKALVSHIRTFGFVNLTLCILAVVLCLWKRIMNVYQCILLLCVGMACYAQALPLGIWVSLRTVYALYIALLMPLCYLLLCKEFRVPVLVVFLMIGITMFTDNYNALRYYNGIFSVWTEHLRTIPNDSRINNQLLFLADNKETSVVEKHIMKVMNLSNRVIEGLGERMRWATSAESLGYHVINKWDGKSIRSITPGWLDKCRFRSNQLYDWAVYNGTIVVRFNPQLMKRIQNK